MVWKKENEKVAHGSEKKRKKSDRGKIFLFHE